MREPHEVVGDEPGRGHLALPRRTNDRDLLLGEDGQLVNHALGANLLGDANDEVCGDHAHEEHVPVLARDEHEHGKDEVDGVEQGEGMLGKDLSDALGLHVSVGIRATLGHTLGDLLVGEAPLKSALIVQRDLPLSLRASIVPRPWAGYPNLTKKRESPNMGRRDLPREAVGEVLGQRREKREARRQGGIWPASQLVRPGGFEPTTFCSGGRRSNPLSYGRLRCKV